MERRNKTPKYKYCLLDRRKKELKKNITPSEERIKGILKQLKIRAVFQKGFIAGKNFCIVDFYIPSLTLVLEIDGGYHNTKTQQARDKNRDFYLSKQRFVSVVHLTNEYADSINENELLKILLDNRPYKKLAKVAYYKLQIVVIKSHG